MSNIEKVLDRVRKFLKLAEHSSNEHEAASAAAQAAKLMEEYQLSDALVRLDDPAVAPEPIVEQRLDPDRVVAHSKRVAWKEAISTAVARSVGVKMFWNWTRIGGRKHSDIRGFGRESAVQTWRYTSQYLWRAVDEFADAAWEASGHASAGRGVARAWKNAFRVGCATRLAIRLKEIKDAEELARKQAKEAAVGAETRDSLAMTLIEKDRDGMDAAYKERSKNFGKAVASIGSTSSYAGYQAGREVGDKIHLGGGRAGLASGRGMLTGEV